MCKQSLCQNAELPRMSRASYTQYSDQETVAPRPIPDREMITQLGESAVEQLAQRLPHLLREKQLKWSESDKIFASRWITESNVLVGTKCNKLYLVDTLAMTNGLCTEEIPTLSNYTRSLERAPSSGIHSVAVSPNMKYVSTSGAHPNDLAIYQLPELAPLLLGQAHSDWIFDIQWITDELVITGSRDSTMALWSVNEPASCQALAEHTPIMDPVFYFSNHPVPPADCGERVRSLAYHKDNFELGSLQTNPCGASLHFWDVYVFQQVYRYVLPFCAENVCVEPDERNCTLYAVGSRSHVTLVDSRTPPRQRAGSVRSPDKECGVRSLNFNHDILSLGTGAGNVYFYDIRAQSFLYGEGTNSYEKCTLHSTPGWLRKDQTYQDFFSGLPRPPNAIYTHSYSPLRTKIFTAGGPLPLGLCGNYAAVWI